MRTLTVKRVADDGREQVLLEYPMPVDAEVELAEADGNATVVVSRKDFSPRIQREVRPGVTVVQQGDVVVKGDGSLEAVVAATPPPKPKKAVSKKG